MRYYAKLSQKDDIGAIKADFVKEGIDVNDVIFDNEIQQKRGGSAYSRLKEELQGTHEPLTIRDMFDLGKNPREVTKELDWFVENGIEIRVLDMPSTMKDGTSVTEILRDANAEYAAREVERLKAGQKKAAKDARKEGREVKRSTGRRRIPYPANWETEYARWEQKEITSAEFMANVGLSQGTFYNLLRQYKEDVLRAEKEESETIKKSG